jgi:protein-tyrosine kinase
MRPDQQETAIDPAIADQQPGGNGLNAGKSRSIEKAKSLQTARLAEAFGLGDPFPLGLGPVETVKPNFGTQFGSRANKPSPRREESSASLSSSHFHEKSHKVLEMPRVEPATVVEKIELFEESTWTGMVPQKFSAHHVEELFEEAESWAQPAILPKQMASNLATIETEDISIEGAKSGHAESVPQHHVEETAADPKVDSPVTHTGWQNRVFSTEPSAEDRAHDDLSSPYRTVWLTIPENGPIFPFDGVDPRVAEQYRILRTSILLHPSKPKVIAISSGSSGDGKTLTAINFAGILAMKDEVTVLIIEGDLRKCSIAPTLGLKSTPGLAEVLNGKATLEQAVVRAGQLPNFHILTGGDITQNPAEMLDSQQFRTFVEQVRQKFTYVVFDTTPAASVADFKLVMQVADGVLMVVRPEHTDRPAYQRAFELIPEKRLLGAVINAFEDWFLWNKMDSNYYYSGEPRAPKNQPFFRWRRKTAKTSRAR